MMPNEPDHTPNPLTPDTGPSWEPGLASAEPPPSGGSGRWFLVAIVLVLVIYPAARWALSRSSGGGTAAGGAGQEEVQRSYQLYQQGRYEDAVAAAKAALAANPKSADAYNNLAVAYMGLHKVDDAIQAAQNAIRLRPDYQLAKNNLAWFQQEKARGGLPPVPPAVATRAGQLLDQSAQHAQAQRFKECMETSAEAAKLDPTSARAFNNLGFCAANLKRWDEAIRNTEEATRLDPTLQLAKNNLAWMRQEKAKAAK